MAVQGLPHRKRTPPIDLQQAIRYPGPNSRQLRCAQSVTASTIGVRTLKTTQLDHVALHVADIDKSCAFYEQVMKLQPIPRPAFKFPGAWYRLGDSQELHLIGERPNVVSGAASRGDHWALMVDDIDQWEAYFQEAGIEYTPRRTRPDGAYQIYVFDPDGHCLELCTPAGIAG